MTKMTKINLDLISDIDQQLFIENGMRGGISLFHIEMQKQIINI